MTDDEKMTNKDDEQEMVESDIEQDDSACSDDKSNGTTDDEFYNELMDAPPEFEDHLIPNGCKDETNGIEHLTTCLNRRYSSCPIVVTGTLKDALKEGFSPKEIKERRPVLIYVNNDKSLYSNLFCKQLLCHDKIVEYLLNNYVLWAWDVTFQSNGEMLNEMCKAAFSSWNMAQSIGTSSVDQYPLLIGIRRNKDGDHSFIRIISGSNKKPVMDEFLAFLIQFKDQFDLGEEDLERAKEENKRQIANTLFRTHDFDHRSVHHNNRDYLSSTSMFPPMNHSRLPPHPRFSINNDNEYFSYNRMNLPDTFHQMSIQPNDSDDEDDDDDQTPTVDHPSPKYPQ